MEGEEGLKTVSEVMRGRIRMGGAEDAIIALMILGVEGLVPEVSAGCECAIHGAASNYAGVVLVLKPGRVRITLARPVMVVIVRLIELTSIKACSIVSNWRP